MTIEQIKTINKQYKRRWYTMNYEWTFLDRGVPDTWRKAKTEKSAFRAAMKVARKLYPEATNKGYTRTIFLEDCSQKIDFGHYTVFIEIRKVNKNGR